MSGLETAAAVSSIFQIISSSREILGLCKKVYRTGSSVDPELAENAVFLGHLSTNIHELCKSGARSKDEQKCFDILQRCQVASRDLIEEVNFINGYAKQGSLESVLKVAAKTQWRKRRLEKLEQRLAELQKLAESGLVVRICNRVDLTQLKLDDLNADLRSFVEKVQAGERTIAGLISTESLRTRHHISTEVSRVDKSVATGFQNLTKDFRRHANTSQAAAAALHKDLGDLKIDEKRRERRDRLLKSLKFPGMNERRNHVTQSFPRTFGWAFGDEDGDEDEDDDNGEDEDDEKSRQSTKNSNRSVLLGTDEISSMRKYQTIFDSDISVTPWDSFGDWLRSDSSIYWINGKPGAGKSTLIKYLLMEDKTQQSLDLWERDTVVISHFFWRVGSQMQQNLKGFLCSLLYQLAEAHETLVDRISSHFSDVVRKDIDTDWNIEELRRVCYWALQNFCNPLCVFVDGLDELYEKDNVLDLFKDLEVIEKLPLSKLCISSRPELRFSKRLGKCPQLRIQDLMIQDHWTYAEKNLQFPTFYYGKEHEHVRQQTIDSLVQKADGVFLWLCLAVKDLNNGLDNDDHLDEVMLRVGRLAPDLESLYKDMWKRLNEQNPVYQQDAAFYFKLVIGSLNLSFGLEKTHRILIEKQLNVLHVTIAKASANFRFEKTIPSSEELANSCRDTIRHIQTRCGGLLEIAVQKIDRPTVSTEFPTMLSLSGRSQNVRFIHRTAMDFLTDTEFGSSILNADQTPKRFLTLKYLRAIISVAYLIPKSSLRSILSHIIAFLAVVRDLKGCSQSPIWESELHDLISLAEHAFESGRVSVSKSAKTNDLALRKDEFLIVAAVFGLSKYLMKALTERVLDSRTKSDILLETTSNLVSAEFFDENFKVVEMLLRLGAQPNIKGRYSTWPRVEAESRFEILNTSFCELLTRMLAADFRCITTSRAINMLHLMDHFMNDMRGVASQIEVCISINDKSARVTSYSVLDWYLQMIGTDSQQRFSILSAPTSVLIDAIIRGVENIIRKLGNPQIHCCSTDHISSIREKSKLCGLLSSVRVVALIDGGGEYCIPSDKDSSLLSSLAMGHLMDLAESYGTIPEFASKLYEVYERSEKRSNLIDFLESEGIIWSYESHKHEPRDECTQDCLISCET